MGRIEDLAKLGARLAGYSPSPQISEGVDLLSLFDGIGGARVALDRAGIPVRNYYSSEVNPSAMEVVRKNWPDVIELGDVTKARAPSNVDLLCAGFPCQDLSRANIAGGKGLAGDKSSLFWQIPRMLDATQPKRGFIVENVLPNGTVDHPDVETISRVLGVDPVVLDAKDFSAMRRPRLFWTNIDVPMYGGSEQLFRNALNEAVPDRYYYSPRAIAGMNTPKGQSGRTPFQRHGMKESDPKARTITASFFRGQPHNALLTDEGQYRKLMPEEIERLFGFPEGYTSGVSEPSRYRGLGNSWSVPTVEHILRGLVD